MAEVVAVWKFALLPGPPIQDIQLPAGAKPLYVAVQSDMPVIYFLVDPTRPRVSRRVRTVATGRPFEIGDAEPVGLLALMDGKLMFHVFVWPEAT